MPTDPPGVQVLTINGGSSSVKFAVYEAPAPGPPGARPRQILSGKIERIGLPDGSLSVRNASGRREAAVLDAPDHKTAVHNAMDWLAGRGEFGIVSGVGAVGHRLVHGGPRYLAPQRVTPEVLDELRHVSPLAPEHLPSAISLIEVFHDRLPGAPQVACFDTAFHGDMPRVAKILPVPRRLQAQGVRRYGFHGLSYAYLLEELARQAGPDAARGRVVLCHFGNGASLAAVRNGKGIDTSMGFTPAAGIPMGTRTGDIDPGLVGYLARTAGTTAEEFARMASHESGLLGVSETSPDMRDLQAREQAGDVRAAEAVSLFCYQARKWVGAYAAALAGLDTLVFAGGIGENSPDIRARVCEGLAFLGIEIDPGRNASNAPIISTDGGRVAVRVIPTDEEMMIAKAVYQMVSGGG